MVKGSDSEDGERKRISLEKDSFFDFDGDDNDSNDGEDGEDVEDDMLVFQNLKRRVKVKVWS